MRKLGITLSIVLSSIFYTNGAKAQNRPLACQGEASAGLSWEGGRWVTSSFIKRNFILVQAGATLTIDSASKALGATPSNVSCKKNTFDVLCTDTSGGTLLFNPDNLKVGLSQILGSTTVGDSRDTVTVQIFSCTPF